MIYYDVVITARLGFGHFDEVHERCRAEMDAYGVRVMNENTDLVRWRRRPVRSADPANYIYIDNERINNLKAVYIVLFIARCTKLGKRPDVRRTNYILTIILHHLPGHILCI